MAKAKPKGRAARAPARKRKKPPGKRSRQDLAPVWEYWAGIEFPIEMLKQHVALQDVVRAQAAADDSSESREEASPERQEEVRRWVKDAMDSLPSVEELRGKYNAGELEVLRIALETSIAKNTAAVAAGFGKQIYKVFTARRVRQAEAEFPGLRTLGIVPDGGAALLGESATDDDVRRHNERARRDGPKGRAVYSPERPWDLARAVAREAGFTNNRNERSLQKFKSKTAPNHVELETVVREALTSGKKTTGNKTT